MKVNHLDIVQDEHAKQPPVSGDLNSCFQFEQRVLARLAKDFPGEGWGYLTKGGENTIEYKHETVKVGRVCDPGTQLYKILTDIPTTNAPIWNDDGVLMVDFPGSSQDDWYLPYDGAVDPDPPPPDPPPTDDEIKQQLDRIEAKVDMMLGTVPEILSAFTQIDAKLTDLVNRTDELKALEKLGRTGSVKVFGSNSPLTINPIS